ncbi:MAG: 4Fe-4S dicluster domain-containing protein [Candidatus Omnitrophota bacterium]
MKTYYLQGQNLIKFYEHIAGEFQLYLPVKIESSRKAACEHSFELPCGDYILKKYAEAKKEGIVFNDYRSIEPVRVFFTPFKEKVCGYFQEEGDAKEPLKPAAICGVKNCDLFALKVQDFVFLEGNEADPFYKARRQNTLIISGDCPNFKESCFCRAFDIDPFASKGFDFNLSPLNDGFLLDAASDRADEIAGSLKGILTPATFGQISGRYAKRESVIKRIEEHLSYHQIPKKETLKEIVVAGFGSSVWQEQVETCIECGACVFGCDTCHCFLLADESKKERAERFRIWDGCLYKNFSTVAGGANPLRRRYMRLRNRYLKKFDFFIDNLGFQACCGCGRCIDACPGRIDIRYILKRLHDEKYLPAG